jgi:hypothetical protein
MKSRTILVLIDGPSTADAVLPKVVDLAKRNDDAKVVLIRALDPATVKVGCEQVAAIDHAAEYLRTVARRLRNEGVDVVRRSVCYAAAAQAIVEAARTVKPAFIVMAIGDADALMPRAAAEFVSERTRTPIVMVADCEAPGEKLAMHPRARIA